MDLAHGSVWAAGDGGSPTNRQLSAYFRCADRSAALQWAPVNERDPVQLARRYIWWQRPEETLANEVRLLCQILSRGTPEDYAAAARHFGRDAFVDAVDKALPGWIDDRSWYFWRRAFGMPETPPPTRRFDEARA